ncbi:hypothetical protein AAMO2058_001190700 [Amorphochlora amoebiformis]
MSSTGSHLRLEDFLEEDNVTPRLREVADNVQLTDLSKVSGESLETTRTEVGSIEVGSGWGMLYGGKSIDMPRSLYGALNAVRSYYTIFHLKGISEVEDYLHSVLDVLQPRKCSKRAKSYDSTSADIETTRNWILDKMKEVKGMTFQDQGCSYKSNAVKTKMWDIGYVKQRVTHVSKPAFQLHKRLLIKHWEVLGSSLQLHPLQIIRHLIADCKYKPGQYRGFVLGDELESLERVVRDLKRIEGISLQAHEHVCAVYTCQQGKHRHIHPLEHAILITSERVIKFEKSSPKHIFHLTSISSAIIEKNVVKSDRIKLTLVDSTPEIEDKDKVKDKISARVKHIGSWERMPTDILCRLINILSTRKEGLAKLFSPIKPPQNIAREMQKRVETRKETLSLLSEITETLRKTKGLHQMLKWPGTKTMLSSDTWYYTRYPDSNVSPAAEKENLRVLTTAILRVEGYDMLRKREAMLVASMEETLLIETENLSIESKNQKRKFQIFRKVLGQLVDFNSRMKMMAKKLIAAGIGETSPRAPSTPSGRKVTSFNQRRVEDPHVASMIRHVALILGLKKAKKSAIEGKLPFKTMWVALSSSSSHEWIKPIHHHLDALMSSKEEESIFFPPAKSEIKFSQNEEAKKGSHVPRHVSNKLSSCPIIEPPAVEYNELTIGESVGLREAKQRIVRGCKLFLRHTPLVFFKTGEGESFSNTLRLYLKALDTQNFSLSEAAISARRLIEDSFLERYARLVVVSDPLIFKGNLSIEILHCKHAATLNNVEVHVKVWEENSLKRSIGSSEVLSSKTNKQSAGPTGTVEWNRTLTFKDISVDSWIGISCRDSKLGIIGNTSISLRAIDRASASKETKSTTRSLEKPYSFVLVDTARAHGGGTFTALPTVYVKVTFDQTTGLSNLRGRRRVQSIASYHSDTREKSPVLESRQKLSWSISEESPFQIHTRALERVSSLPMPNAMRYKLQKHQADELRSHSDRGVKHSSSQTDPKSGAIEIGQIPPIQDLPQLLAVSKVILENLKDCQRLSRDPHVKRALNDMHALCTSKLTGKEAKSPNIVQDSQKVISVKCLVWYALSFDTVRVLKSGKNVTCRLVTATRLGKETIALFVDGHNVSGEVKSVKKMKKSNFDLIFKVPKDNPCLDLTTGCPHMQYVEIILRSAPTSSPPSLSPKDIASQAAAKANKKIGTLPRNPGIPTKNTGILTENPGPLSPSMSRERRRRRRSTSAHDEESTLIRVIVGVEMSHIESVDSMMRMCLRVGLGAAAARSRRAGRLLSSAAKSWVPMVMNETKRLLERAEGHIHSKQIMFTHNLGVVWRVNACVQSILTLVAKISKVGYKIEDLHTWMAPFTQYWISYHDRRFDTHYLPKMLEVRGWTPHTRQSEETVETVVGKRRTDPLIVDLFTLLSGLENQFHLLPNSIQYLHRFRKWVSIWVWRVVDIISALTLSDLRPLTPTQSLTHLDYCKKCLPIATANWTTNDQNQDQKGKPEWFARVFGIFGSDRKKAGDTIAYGLCDCGISTEIIQKINALIDCKTYLRKFLINSSRKSRKHKSLRKNELKDAKLTIEEKKKEKKSAGIWVCDLPKVTSGYNANRAMCSTTICRLRASNAARAMCSPTICRLLSLAQDIRMKTLSIYQIYPLFETIRASPLTPPPSLTPTYIPLCNALLDPRGRGGGVWKVYPDGIEKTIECVLEKVARGFSLVFEYCLERILAPGGKPLKKARSRDEFDDALEPLWVFVLHHVSPLISANQQPMEGCLHPEAISLLLYHMEAQMLKTLEHTLLSHGPRSVSMTGHQLVAVREIGVLVAKCLKAFFEYDSSRSSFDSDVLNTTLTTDSANLDEKQICDTDSIRTLRRINSMLDTLEGSTTSLVSFYKWAEEQEQKIRDKVQSMLKDFSNFLTKDDAMAISLWVRDSWRENTSPHLRTEDVITAIHARGIKNPKKWRPEEGVEKIVRL